MEKISAHISYLEGIFSATGMRLGIKNEPSKAILATMRVTARNVFEPMREFFDTPIRIISFYRCPALNKAVGGSKTSQHMTGQAIDVQGMEELRNATIFEYYSADEGTLDFDQCIAEFPVKGEPAWVHISYKARGKNRNQCLVAIKRKGKTVYLPYEGNEKLVF